MFLLKLLSNLISIFLYQISVIDNDCFTFTMIYLELTKMGFFTQFNVNFFYKEPGKQ